MMNHHVLVLEAFYGGSHRQLIAFLENTFKEANVKRTVVTMTDKKWHWRMRSSALYFAEHIPANEQYSCVFVTAVTNLAELVGLRAELASVRKVLYFHENQLVYPVKKVKDRDFHLTADVVLFNSRYNMSSFLEGISSYMNLMPDYRSKGLRSKIEPKCSVLYFPIKLCTSELPVRMSDVLHITWPHRWEHDKNPDEFFEVMYQLHEMRLPFQLSVIGQTYAQIPECFEEAKSKLHSHIVDWGFQSDCNDYVKILKSTDVVVSTAYHEFFGVAMLEAVSMGCYSLCPNRLVYPEFFPPEHLYNTQAQLVKKLKRLCKYPRAARESTSQIDLEVFSEKSLRQQYLTELLAKT